MEGSPPWCSARRRLSACADGPRGSQRRRSLAAARTRRARRCHAGDGPARCQLAALRRPCGPR
eukprot:8571913-Alexandrium_andersonii.AAC.1